MLALDAKTHSGGTADRIVEVAQRLLQTRVYNGFSYADIALELGLTKASLHHHFCTKAHLGDSVVRRHLEYAQTVLRGIDAEGLDAFESLRRYAQVYEDVLLGDRMCLCGILAAEFDTVPALIQESISEFFRFNAQWLAQTIARGRAAGSVRGSGSDEELAQLLLSTLEGALLICWPGRDRARLSGTVRLLLESLRA